MKWVWNNPIGEEQILVGDVFIERQGLCLCLAADEILLIRSKSKKQEGRITPRSGS